MYGCPLTDTIKHFYALLYPLQNLRLKLDDLSGKDVTFYVLKHDLLFLGLIVINPPTHS